MEVSFSLAKGVLANHGTTCDPAQSVSLNRVVKKKQAQGARRMLEWQLAYQVLSLQYNVQAMMNTGLLSCLK